MNVSTFRSYLSEKDKRLDNIYDPITRAIQGGEFRDSASLWSNKELVNAAPPVDIRVANVIFPSRVHLLSTSVFYDRIYVDVDDYNDDVEQIDNENLFCQAYQMFPKDFLALVRTGTVVPIFKLGMSTYSDFMLREILFPIITNDLPFITFEGHALICQVWQLEYNALPDPKERTTWGFLMDLCGAMGMNANLVRPDFVVDWWDRRRLIFDTLSIDELRTQFHSSDIPLNDFFVATGIDYDSSVPVEEYLSAFKNIDREKLYSLYKKIDKETFYSEMHRVNELSREVSKRLDQHHRHRQVLSVGLVFLWCVLREWLGSLFSGPIVNGVERLSDDQLAKVLTATRVRFLDSFTRNWEKHQHWLKDSEYPEVLQVVKIQKILKRR